MKGITHFTVGVAAASCFPQAVQAGAEGNPLYFLLGGICGLLPDTLDFKFYRFFYPQAVTVTPDPHRPDARAIADGVAGAIHAASRTGEPVRIRLNTIRLGTDRWQRYTVRFDVTEPAVTVTYGPVVNTGGRPIEAAPDPVPSATVSLACPVRPAYRAETDIDIFDGALFTMDPTGEGVVVPRFITWHRAWTHSLVIGLLPALVSVLAWGELAGCVALLAFGLHVTVDQLGFMGSNLFYPFTRGRTEGLKLTHSGDASANLGVVWLCCLLVFWNLQYQAIPEGAGINLLQLCFFGAIAPGMAWGLLRRRLRRA